MYRKKGPVFNNTISSDLKAAFVLILHKVLNNRWLKCYLNKAYLGVLIIII